MLSVRDWSPHCSFADHFCTAAVTRILRKKAKPAPCGAPVGDVGVKGRRLTEVTYEAMMRGIEVVKPGATTGDIGYAANWDSYNNANTASAIWDHPAADPPKAAAGLRCTLRCEPIE